MKKLFTAILAAILLTAAVALASEVPVPETQSLAIGEMKIYNFGDIKLHVYKTLPPCAAG